MTRRESLPESAGAQVDVTCTPSLPSLRLEVALLAALLVAVGTVYYATVRPGHDWGGDFSMYLMNARNLVQGRPYAQTGYLYDPAVTVGPRAYPPGFPALLTVPLTLHGLDLEAVKRYMVGFPLAFLALFYLLARSRLGMAFALGVSALTAASPMLWDLKERILSDVPFLVWLFLAFVVAHRAEQRGWYRTHPVGSGLLLGAVAAMCAATRTVGLVLVPALILLDVLRRRRVRLATWVALAVISVAWALQAATLHLEADYVRLAQTLHAAGPAGARSSAFLGLDPGALPARLLALPGDLSVFWTWMNPGDTLTKVTTMLVGLCALPGAWIAWRRGPTLADTFSPLYLCLLLVLPTGLGTESRLYLPLLVMLYLYAALGLDALRIRLGPTPALAAALAVSVALTVSYERSFSVVRRMTFDLGPLGPEAVAAFRYIRANTAPDSTFAFSKPRVLALFTDRGARALPDHASSGELLDLLTRTKTDYLIVHTLLDRHTIGRLRSVVSGRPVVYRSDHFILFALRRQEGPTKTSRARASPPLLPARHGPGV